MKHLPPPARSRRRFVGALCLFAPLCAAGLTLTALSAGCGGGGGDTGGPDVLPSVPVVPSASPSSSASPIATLTPSPSASATPTPVPADPALAGYEQAAVTALNALRAQNGLPALRAVDALTQAARSHSKDMAEEGYFAHTDPTTGEGVAGRVDDQGYSFTKVGENLIYVENVADPGTFAITQWGESPEHRAAMLDTEFSDVGIGLWQSPTGRVYVTAVFAKP